MKCQCEHYSHFWDDCVGKDEIRRDELRHSYGKEVGIVTIHATPFGLFFICEECRKEGHMNTEKED